ncbi:MAG TPA: alpha/beta hydrolase [Candidatus Cybelea sp.]|nr:alpha/beta hydrolase [Candidatus Cybelea sp.]
MTALVLLPGLDGTGLLFADFVAELGGEFEAIVLPYPTDEALTYAQLEATARASLPIDRPFALLGESFSGPIAISIAASRPPGLVALILCCSFARYPRRILRLLRPLASVVPVKGRLVSLLRGIVSPRRVSNEVQAKLAEANAKVSRPVLRRRIKELLRIDARSQLRKVDVPVLYLAASQDAVVPFGACREICACLPSVRVVKLESPHFLLQAIPRQAANAIRDFLKPAQTHPFGRA